MKKNVSFGKRTLTTEFMPDPIKSSRLQPLILTSIFDRIFERDSNQEVFEYLGRAWDPVASWMMFFYGASGSGKTFTLFGNTKEEGVGDRFVKKFLT